MPDTKEKSEKKAAESTRARKRAGSSASSSRAKKPAASPVARKRPASGSKAVSAEDKVIRIDGRDYSVGGLTDEARAQILNLQATDQRIEHLKRELLITQTARQAYAEALESELGASKDATLQ